MVTELATGSFYLLSVYWTSSSWYKNVIVYLRKKFIPTQNKFLATPLRNASNKPLCSVYALLRPLVTINEAKKLDESIYSVYPTRVMFDYSTA